MASTHDEEHLVHLLQGNLGQPIECEVFKTCVHHTEGVPYEALSHVWGTRKAAGIIWLDSCPFMSFGEKSIRLRGAFGWVVSDCGDYLSKHLANRCSGLSQPEIHPTLVGNSALPTCCCSGLLLPLIAKIWTPYIICIE